MLLTGWKGQATDTEHRGRPMDLHGGGRVSVSNIQRTAWPM